MASHPPGANPNPGPRGSSLQSTSPSQQQQAGVLGAPVRSQQQAGPSQPSRDGRARFQPPLRNQQSSIRIRRLPVAAPPNLAPIASESNIQPTEGGHVGPAIDRRGAVREPHHQATPSGGSAQTAAAIMKPLPSLPDEAQDPGTAALQTEKMPERPGRGQPKRLRRASTALMGGIGRRRQTQTAEVVPEAAYYDSRVVDFLDAVDPEVATLSTVTNVQNSLFVPSLGRWINRRPVYDLSFLQSIPGAFPPSQEDMKTEPGASDQDRPTADRMHSLSSVLTAPQYAVLPDGESLEGWSVEDIKLVNDHVRHMLHSKRSKVKQRLRAFGQYVRRPLGFFVTLYATFITLFGLAWVLFLIGWIYVGDKQLFVINVIDNVLVALFAIVGDGLAPFRAIDTYHMIFVAHYHRKTWKLRDKLFLPELSDDNDLPTDDVASTADTVDTADIEAAREVERSGDGPVLPPKEQARFVRHQAKLAKSHTFYKPHETDTHHAFPLRLLIAIVLLLDLHSCLQISLGACTWGIDYRVRPTALTTTILCCSIAANSTAGLLIMIGDRRTRKKDVLERMFKQDLTQQAIDKVQKQNRKAGGDNAEAGGEDGEGLKEKWQGKLNLLGRKSEDHTPRAGEDSRKPRDKIGRFDWTMGANSAGAAEGSSRQPPSER